MSGFIINDPTQSPVAALVNQDQLNVNVSVRYAVSFVTHFGETLVSPVSDAINIPNFTHVVERKLSKSKLLTSLNNHVRVSNIAIAANPNVIKRRVYRISGDMVSLVREIAADSSTVTFDALPIGANLAALPTINTANSLRAIGGSLNIDKITTNKLRLTAGAPVDVAAGSIYYDSQLQQLRINSQSAWHSLITSNTSRIMLLNNIGTGVADTSAVTNVGQPLNVLVTPAQVHGFEAMSSTRMHVKYTGLASAIFKIAFDAVVYKKNATGARLVVVYLCKKANGAQEFSPLSWRETVTNMKTPAEYADGQVVSSADGVDFAVKLEALEALNTGDELMVYTRLVQNAMANLVVRAASMSVTFDSAPAVSRAAWMSGRWGVRVMLPSPAIANYMNFDSAGVLAQLAQYTQAKFVMIHLSQAANGFYFTSYNPTSELLDAALELAPGTTAPAANVEPFEPFMNQCRALGLRILVYVAGQGPTKQLNAETYPDNYDTEFNEYAASLGMTPNEGFCKTYRRLLCAAIWRIHRRLVD